MTLSAAPIQYSWRERLHDFIERPAVQHGIIGLILVNAVLLGVETSATVMASAGELIQLMDQLILALFVIELTVRIYAHRLAFWRDPWSLFDFSVVAIALIPASGPFAVLRALRVLRVLRLLSMVPSMRRVVGALLAAIPGLGSIALVLMILYYVFAVIATNLFAASHPEWFGTIGHSFYTLFQIMTLESWSMGIVRPIMETYPFAWALFIPFILVATFTILNLFIAIIVNAMQNFSENEHPETFDNRLQPHETANSDLQEELSALRIEIRELKELLSTQGIGKSEENR
jgi:voltage-gated sodium channel